MDSLLVQIVDKPAYDEDGELRTEYQMLPPMMRDLVEAIYDRDDSVCALCRSTVLGPLSYDGFAPYAVIFHRQLRKVWAICEDCYQPLNTRALDDNFES